VNHYLLLICVYQELITTYIIVYMCLVFPLRTFVLDVLNRLGL